jgi:hypothetical protein
MQLSLEAKHISVFFYTLKITFLVWERAGVLPSAKKWQNFHHYEAQRNSDPEEYS